MFVLGVARRNATCTSDEREIVEKQGGESRAKYGNGLIDSLVERLTAEFGPGFTRSNLRNMRQFHLMFPIRHTVCGKLSWSHYRTLITIEDAAAPEDVAGVSYHSYRRFRSYIGP